VSNLYYDAGPSASGRKILLATTAYDSPDASYTFSIARSREALTAAGFQSAYLLLQGNCHVDDARNSVVSKFLESDCTDLVFIDADVSWEPERLVTLCGYDKDIVGGVYPYRRESEKDSMPVRMLKQPSEPDENGLIEVEGLPTGFMKIQRHVLETMASVARSFRKDEGPSIPILFERDFFGIGRRGGDIRFCMVWREMGGKVYAAQDLVLGHCGKHVIKDSLAASLRRQNNKTLSYVIGLIRENKATIDTFREMFRAAKNPWAAQPDVLDLAVGLARSSSGPILEIGSGLSTVLMAAATDKPVWCVEHDPIYVAKLEALVVDAGVRNVTLVTCPLMDGWYDPSEDIAMMPEKFGVAFVDGPPRHMGDRMRFFEVFGDRCDTILCDDADDTGYRDRLTEWAKSQHRDIKIDGRAAVILPKMGGDGW
jgi:predicted O-methyltransferase YrrM